MQPTSIETLQRMPIFGAIRDDVLLLLLDRARTIEAQRGTFFFREHDEASSMFVLEAGRAVVLKHCDDRDFVLHTLVPGDCFGEMALMDLLPRSASVRAQEDCRAIEIDTDDLMALFERDIEQFALLQMNIGREVCRRLRATDELLFRAGRGAATPGPEGLFRDG
jgi:CRP-like cAMP-binding protein